MTLGEKLKNLRKEKNLTQTELGLILGVGKSAISQYESDKNAPDYNMLLKLSNLYKVSIDFLLGNSDKKSSIDGYYVNEETAQYAEELRTNSELKVLFSASKSLSKADMKKAYEYIKFLKSQEHSEDDFIE